MKLSRELVRRMAGRNGSSSSTSYGGGGGGGGASPSWVEENYISKAFFNRLFTIHSATGTITPNDVETSVDNIEALAGFWTDSYVSALGQNSEGGGGGGSSTLAGLLDVALSSPQDGQALVYDTDTGKWVNGDVTPDLSLYATKDWVQQQGYLTASDLTGYATQQWVGQQGYLTASALTGYATQQWVQQQGYATQQWVQQQGYLTSSDISDMATMTWVGQQGFAYASNVYSKEAADARFLTISFFRSLFRARTASGTEVAPNDGDTSTITNIKAMFGFWTDQYISALGQNSSGGGGGSSTLAGLLDVALSSPQDGQALVYDAATGKWVNGDVSPDLTGYATQQWVQQQGYLTSSALTGYATQQWVQQQGYLTASAISDMATKTWVGQQGFVKTVAGTFWGQPWTNGDTIYGSLSNVYDIDLDGMISFHYNDATSYTSRLYEDQSGRLKMDAQVYIPSQQSLRIGDAVLSWDGTNGALKIQNADGTAGSLYATGGLSALGMSAGASSVERMTFGYVDITNRITFGDNSRYISYDDGIVLHPLSGDNVQVSAQLYVSRGIEVEGNILTDGYDVKLDGGKLYLDTTRYIIVSSGVLKYYDGVNLRTISLE